MEIFQPATLVYQRVSVFFWGGEDSLRITTIIGVDPQRSRVNFLRPSDDWWKKTEKKKKELENDPTPSEKMCLNHLKGS